ncbi:hypothetical protein VNI00_017969 [Paramarasmius palmivorus]|uniref:Anaphase-promoting complex subunit 2 n=1 Tax=Paramarasmius palmivorus TaxID=297713 RepID=A0AAW0B2S5_9AGAR
MSTDALRSQVAAKWQSAFLRINREQPGISGLLSFSKAWDIATEFVRPKDLNNEAPSTYDMDTIRAAYDVVNQSRRLPVLLETFLDQVHQKFYLITNEVEQFIAEYEVPHPSNHSILRSHQLITANNGSPGDSEASGETIDMTLCASTLPSSEPGAQASEPDYALWEAFETLGLLDRYESIIASVGYEHIEAHVLANCTGQWVKPMLESLRTWMSDKIVPWMLLMYARGATSTEDARAMLQNVGSRFDFHMAKTLCDLRTREIFDIIIDYPESSGALNDLKECLQRVDQRAALVQALRKAYSCLLFVVLNVLTYCPNRNRKRLLHPGADTRLILSQYVATIKCLRIVDPPGVLLFKVADPIRRYLRERPDTIRCIVANLVGDDDSGESLVDESEPIQPLQQAELEDYTDPNWEPEPLDAGPDFRTNKPSDVISTLVSIYDSKDLFVKELQVLLAQRLLAISDDNTDKIEKEPFFTARREFITRNLMIAFGVLQCKVCEVNVVGYPDSKRIDGHVQSQKASIVHPTIISKHFWPLLETSKIVMPGQFQTLQEQYAKEFTTFKPDKSCHWIPHLGTVHLELQLEDRTVEADVPPLEAAFIELFSDKSVWTVDELIAGVGSVDRAAAIKALLTWVNKGVLKEDGEDTFKLLEIAEEPTPGRETTRAAAVSAQQQQAEKMKVHWKFIEGMLTNLGTLPLDRIQTMLRFAPGYDQTIEQLAAFMEAARREGLVNVKDGMWKLTQRA